MYWAEKAQQISNFADSMLDSCSLAMIYVICGIAFCEISIDYFIEQYNNSEKDSKSSKQTNIEQPNKKMSNFITYR